MCRRASARPGPPPRADGKGPEYAGVSALPAGQVPRSARAVPAGGAEGPQIRARAIQRGGDVGSAEGAKADLPTRGDPEGDREWAGDGDPPRSQAPDASQ